MPILNQFTKLLGPDKLDVLKSSFVRKEPKGDHISVSFGNDIEATIKDHNLFNFNFIRKPTSLFKSYEPDCIYGRYRWHCLRDICYSWADNSPVSERFEDFIKNGVGALGELVISDFSSFMQIKRSEGEWSTSQARLRTPPKNKHSFLGKIVKTLLASKEQRDYEERIKREDKLVKNGDGLTIVINFNCLQFNQLEDIETFDKIHNGCHDPLFTFEDGSKRILIWNDGESDSMFEKSIRFTVCDIYDPLNNRKEIVVKADEDPENYELVRKSLIHLGQSFYGKLRNFVLNHQKSNKKESVEEYELNLFGED